MVHYLKPNYQCPENLERFEEIKHCEGPPKCAHYHGHSPMGIIFCSSNSDIPSNTGKESQN